MRPYAASLKHSTRHVTFCRWIQMHINSNASLSLLFLTPLSLFSFFLLSLFSFSLLPTLSL
ncbi:hypothetical protein HanIR_Chr08g0376371 [Helianthus annuus]|nr:hypothetical protein HanIR_Chr08g0376371 [Helianthus annuus]